MRTPLASQQRLIDALATHPEALDEGPTEYIETHFSWVILTRRYAFKCKKALAHEWLPHDTPADRRRACWTEVHLNRRLAPAVYLDVIGLALGDDGRVRPATAATEYLVQMRRLPDAASLEAQLAAGTLSAAAIDRLGHRLGRFYAELPPERPAPAQYWRELTGLLVEWRDEACTHMPAAESERAGALQRRLDELAHALRATLEERTRLGRLCEAHGDLRPAHVYFLPEPVAIDCLEFSRPLRILDPVDELAFLAMECRRLGAGWIGSRLAACYTAQADDRPPRALWIFHAARRALLWALLGLRHLDRPDTGDSAHWQRRAAAYIRLGHAILDELAHDGQHAAAAAIPWANSGAADTQESRSEAGNAPRA